MKIKIKTVFICEFCKKKMFQKKAMERHESFCLKNKDNFPACFNDCKHFTQHTENDYYEKNEGGEIVEREGSQYYPFYCSKKEVPMHNKKSEVLKREFIKNLETELMPINCKDFEDSYFPF